MENLKKISYTDGDTEYFIASIYSLEEVKQMLYQHTIYDGWGNSGDKIMEGIVITEPAIYSIKRDGNTGFYIGELKKLV